MQKVNQKFRSLFTGKFRFASVLSISLLAMLLLQVAGASAKSLSQDPVYYACANYKTGKIYVIQQNGTCKLGYTMIQWDQTGPQGPQGPAGVSQGYFNVSGNVNIASGNQSLIPVVATNPVAAGTYIITATEVALIDTGDQVACLVASVNGSGGGTGGNYWGTAGRVSSPQYSTITITDTLSASAGDQIELLCIDYTNDTTTISYNAGISAIQLNAVDSNAHPMGHKLAPPPLPHH